MNLAHRSGWRLVLCLVLAVGCGGSPAASDAGSIAPDARADAAQLADAMPRVDAAPLADAGVADAFIAPDAASNDASSRHDAPIVRADGGASASDVARCESIASMVTTACHGQVDRTCEHTQGAMFCGRERADVLADAYQCLLDRSTDSCRTFGDPSGARPCLIALAAATEVTHARTIANAVVALCPTATVDGMLVAGALPLMALSDDTLDDIGGCLAGASDCDAVEPCLYDPFPTIRACYP